MKLRNFVGGIINTKISNVNNDIIKDIDIVFHEVIKPDLIPIKQFNFLEKHGFNTVYHKEFNEINYDILKNLFEERYKKSEYVIDGLVITENKLHSRNISNNPEYSFSFKERDKIKGKDKINTVVKDIYWNITKDGIIFPTIILEPINISGVIIQNVTGNNAKYVIDNKIGKNAVVEMIRSGDVIPKIEKVIKGSNDIPLPLIPYKWDKNEVNFIVDKSKTNIEKDSIYILRNVTNFFKTIGTADVNEGIIKKLIDKYPNKNINQIIMKIITMKPEDFLEIDGFKDKLANKVHYNIQKSLQNLDISKLMVASNIFGRGFSN